METRAFTVPGAPEGKARPRFRCVNGHVQTYTPKDTVRYEDRITLAYRLVYHGAEPFEGAVVLRIVAYYPIPKSWTKKRQALAAAGHLMPVVKPDMDNVMKAAMDALNGVAYKDDKQIVEAVMRKRYGEQPRLEVTVEGYDGQGKAD